MRRTYDQRIKWDVFQEKSTYLNDYRWYEGDERIIYRWEPNRIEHPPKPTPTPIKVDNETLSVLQQKVHIPFNLLWEPTPITGTNPNDKINTQITEKDPDIEDAIKNRPRIYMSPAVSMDDVPDSEMRKLLCRYMYTTEWKKATEEAAPVMIPKKIPERVAEAGGGDPVRLKVENMIPLPEGWRQKGKPWDREQKRAMVDPTQTFWINKDPPVKCGACENPLAGLVPVEAKNHIKNLVENNNLRLPLDYTKPGYTGYRPRMTRGCSLEKKDFPFSHPMTSCTEALQKNYVNY